MIVAAYKGGKLEIQHSAPDIVFRWTKRFYIPPTLVREMYKLSETAQEDLLTALRVQLRFHVKDHYCYVLHAVVELSKRPCYIEYTIKSKNCRPDTLLPSLRSSFRTCTQIIIDKIHA